MALPFDFAFEGFRIIRERPKLIAFWGAVSLFGYGVMALILIALLGPALPDFTRLGEQANNIVLAESLVRQILPAIAACAPIYFVMSAVLSCAICRASFSEGDDRLGFLRFGVRELQILAINLAVFGLVLLVFVAAIMCVSVLAAPLGSALPSAGLLVFAIAATWLQTRLSLNVPQSFASRRIDIFGSLALTQGRFWPLLGGYLMAFGLSTIVGYLCDQVIRAVVVIGFNYKTDAAVDASSLQAFLIPARITLLAMNFAIVTPLTSTILSAAPVAAYKALKPAPGGMTVPNPS